MLSAVEAHATCLALVFADLVARTIRVQALAKGVGDHLTFRQSFVVNCFADAGATLTPLRLGGEPARLVAMLRSGMHASAAFMTIAFEAMVAWPVVLVTAAFVALRFAPAWWRQAGPALETTLRNSWGWVLLVVVLTLATLIAGRRLARLGSRHAGRPFRRVLVCWRRMSWWPLALSAPLSFVNVASRTALLPILALTLDRPPDVATLIVGSFTLIYGQLFLPTPAGAGAVELGFLGGAAGALGGGAAWLLLMWRLYSSGIGAALGVLFAVRMFGWPAVASVMRWGRGRTGSRVESRGSRAESDVTVSAATGQSPPA